MEQTETLAAATRHALEEAVKKAAPDKRINCAAALALARKFSVPPRLVGEIANQLSIKISKCQLGCF
ncbi:MAG: hypothetical protein P8130_09100 [Deltaproteobacteria bacterium]